MKRMKKSLSGLVWISIVILLLFSYFKASNRSDELFKLFESFDNYIEINAKPEVYRVSLHDEEVGYLAFGKAYGYQSDVVVGVVIADDGHVLETLIIDQNETPSFITKIYNADFLKRQFEGKSIEDGFELSENITAVSGATISSRAITKGVAEASKTVAEGYLGKTVQSHLKVKFGAMEAVLIGMMFLALLSYKLNNSKLRYLTMAYSVILLGFKYRQFIAYSWIVSLLLGKSPSFTDNVGWYILIVGTILFIVLTGKNVYCSCICPFGALQEAGKRLSGFEFFRIHPEINRRLRELPGILAYIAFAGAVITEQIGVLSFEPFSLIYGRTGTGIQWVLLPIVLIMSLFVMRFYCGYACPVGVALNTAVKLRRYAASWFGDSGKKAEREEIKEESKRLTA